MKKTVVALILSLQILFGSFVFIQNSYALGDGSTIEVKVTEKIP